MCESNNSCNNSNSETNTTTVARLDINQISALPFFEVVKNEYVIERNKKQSLENRSGFMLAVIGSICIFLLDKLKFSSVISMMQNTLTYYTFMKITFALITYLALLCSIFWIVLILRTKKYKNFDTDSITDDYLKADRVEGTFVIVHTYIEVISQHRAINEKIARYLNNCLYFFLIMVMSIVIYFCI